MRTIYVLTGIPSSGKSTKAIELRKNENAIWISSDNIREVVNGDPASQEKGGIVFGTLYLMIEYFLKFSKQNIVVDATSVGIADRAKILKIANKFQVKKVSIFVNTPLETCKLWNARRTRIVPDEVLEKFSARLTKPTLEEGFDELLEIKDNSASLTDDNGTQDLFFFFQNGTTTK